MTQRFVWQEGDFVVVRPGEQPRRPARSRASGSVELAKVRRAQEVTQSELAEQLGVGQEQISRFERRGDFRMSTVLEYLKGLDVTDVELTLTFQDGTEMVLPLPL
jgi:DNA-binding XRE family transcriptional regulator